jgi:hypothetical protein
VDKRLRHLPQERARLESLVEIYQTALEELRRWRLPQTAQLIITLESLLATAIRDLRYVNASAHAASMLSGRQQRHGSR